MLTVIFHICFKCGFCLLYVQLRFSLNFFYLGFDKFLESVNLYHYIYLIWETFRHHFLKIFFWPKLFVISAKPASIMGVNMTDIYRVASDSFMGPWSVQLHKVQYSEGSVLDFMLCCLEIFNNFCTRSQAVLFYLESINYVAGLVDSTVLWHRVQVRDIYC